MSVLDSIKHKLNIRARGEEDPVIGLENSLREKLLPGTVSKKAGISKARVNASLGSLRKLVSFFRFYPDIYLDLIKDPQENFELKPYQRLFLRAILRHRYVYCTFVRGYSKSFIAVLANYLKCVFYPNSKVFMVSPGKQQSVSIIIEKVEEIWKFWPALRKEILEGRGSEYSKMQKDFFRLHFKNGSYFDVLACNERSRGQRRTAGIIEESAQIDGKILTSVILPTMNISRRAACGYEDPNDITNKSQTYITTAGEKGTYAYDRLTQILIWSVARPDESLCIGGSWRIPVMYNLLSKDFVKDLKEDGSYSDAVFAREYESQWGGGNMDSFFNGTEFDKHRVLETPMFEPPIKPPAGCKFIMGYDVGRNNDQSTCSLLYLVPSIGNTYIKRLVNLFAFEKMHYLDQAVKIKQLALKFNVDTIVIDANGPGIGLVDFLTVKTVDRNTQETYPAFGVIKESDPKEMYKNFYYVEDSHYNNKIFLIRASESLNAEMHNLVSAQIATGKVEFLIDDQLAKSKWQKKQAWGTYSSERRVEILRPYVMTRILREEMMNLRRKSENSLALTKIAQGMKKDKFSSFEYALYYARLLESKKRNNTNIEQINLSTSTGAGPGQRQKRDFSRRGGFKRGSNTKFRRT